MLLSTICALASYYHMAGVSASQLFIGPQLQSDPAWARAKATYEQQRKKLKATDLVEITGSASPHDLASFIKQVQDERGKMSPGTECGPPAKHRKRPGAVVSD